MAGAASAMREVLADVAFSDPTVPLLANADATILATAAACRRELVDHLTAGVDWVHAVESMVESGVTAFIEVGPGRVLTGLTKRISDQAVTYATDDPAAPDRLAVPNLSPSPA
jgi:[acyl-carrier-protein] S-malonyltransferase